MSPEAIKSFRMMNGWSQQKLADVLGVDQATISRIENGTAAPSKPVRLLLEHLANGGSEAAA